jgi:heme-degrading monooxygenase HmoA
MYAVIFKAEINQLDSEYSAMAERMRDLAINEYGCTEFAACTEGNNEIAISYWPSQEHIKAWHSNAEHKIAQKLGKEKWYKSYRVQVTQVLR